MPPAGPLSQKQITVIQVPSLDKNKDKNNKTGGEANKDQLRVSMVSSVVTVQTFNLICESELELHCFDVLYL
jgi:hypothetical protein